jgi:tetratricopeptide (TPR) repeat protein
MKKFILLLLSLFLFAGSFSQEDVFTKEEHAKMKKVKKLYEKKKYSDAITLLEPIVLDHKKNKALWENLCLCYSRQYHEFRGLGNFTISVDSGTNPETAKMLTDLFSGGLFRNEYINCMRRATLMCGGLEMIGAELRAMVIDSRFRVDTGISEAARKNFNKAETCFAQQDYTNAAKYYNKALKTDPDYYKAYLYLGDSYYQNGEFEEAEDIFQECADTFPCLLEPIKYYYDAVYHQKDYKKAYDIALRALFVCPDIGMLEKFDRVCSDLGMKFKQHWMSRTNLPNKPSGNNSEIETAPWKYYREAYDLVREYVDTVTGILRPNSVTKARYLEEYCWSYMLEKTDKSKFEFARKMKDKGMLDCYVLFSLFHVDLYDQYTDLVKNNSAKLKKYIEEELIEK